MNTLQQRRAVLARLALAATTALGLAGCGGGSMNDLHQYVSKVEARRAPPIKPIPEIKPYGSYAYSDDNLRSPFEPPVETAEQSNVRPDAHRNKEYLEQFPLDSLKMVGTLKIDGVEYALIRDADGVVHKVTRGNYMGQNDGRIVKIADSGMQLQEIVPNGLGGYVKRQTDVVLATSPKAGG